MTKLRNFTSPHLSSLGPVAYKAEVHLLQLALSAPVRVFPFHQLIVFCRPTFLLPSGVQEISLRVKFISCLLTSITSIEINSWTLCAYVYYIVTFYLRPGNSIIRWISLTHEVFFQMYISLVLMTVTPKSNCYLTHFAQRLRVF